MKKLKGQGKGSGSPIVRLCTCLHEFQDWYYGKGRRLHNPTEKGIVGSINKLFRSTV